MFTFQMLLANGSPAEPPQFVSSIPNGSVGDKVIVGSAPRYRIVAVVYDEQHDETTWTVEPV